MPHRPPTGPSASPFYVCIALQDNIPSSLPAVSTLHPACSPELPGLSIGSTEVGQCVTNFPGCQKAAWPLMALSSLFFPHPLSACFLPITADCLRPQAFPLSRQLHLLRREKTKVAEGAPHNCHVLIQHNSPRGSGVLNTQRIVDGLGDTALLEGCRWGWALRFQKSRHSQLALSAL